MLDGPSRCNTAYLDLHMHLWSRLHPPPSAAPNPKNTQKHSNPGVLVGADGVDG